MNDRDTIIAIAAGSRHTVALNANGTVVAWGYNDFGQTTVPAGLSGVTAIASGDNHSLALNANGTVLECGLYGEKISSIHDLIKTTK